MMFRAQSNDQFRYSSPPRPMGRAGRGGLGPSSSSSFRGGRSGHIAHIGARHPQTLSMMAHQHMKSWLDTLKMYICIVYIPYYIKDTYIYTYIYVFVCGETNIHKSTYIYIHISTGPSVQQNTAKNIATAKVIRFVISKCRGYFLLVFLTAANTIQVNVRHISSARSCISSQGVSANMQSISTKQW